MLDLSCGSGMEYHLKRRGRHPAQSGVGPDGVVKGLEVGENGSLRVTSGLKAVQVDQLTLQATEEVFGHGIVIGIALARHTLAKVQGFKPFPVGGGRVLGTAVAVEDESGGELLPSHGHIAEESMTPPQVFSTIIAFQFRKRYNFCLIHDYTTFNPTAQRPQYQFPSMAPGKQGRTFLSRP